MLLYVLESKGSSPGRQGFMMVVNEAGEMQGSIGGGIMEHKLVDLAREKISDKNGADKEAFIKKQTHNKIAASNQSGMICSGEQTILFYPVKKEDVPTIENIISSLEQNKNGTLELRPTTLLFEQQLPQDNFYFEFHSEKDWVYREKTGYKHFLHIIGGGHCSLALSRLMRGLDFFVKVYEDRKELNTLSGNEAAHEKICVNEYSGLTDLIPPGPDQYVVLMTMGYRTDDIALRALMQNEFAYIGMLGSSSKRAKMMDGYLAEGLPFALLQRIHSPAGLLIGSQTPEEIAVSIAAEIINTRNRI